MNYYTKIKEGQVDKDKSPLWLPDLQDPVHFFFISSQNCWNIEDGEAKDGN